MGSVQSIASITGTTGKVDLSWTRVYNQKLVDEIRLWAAPCRYQTPEIIEGNKKMLRVFLYFNQKGLLILTDSDLQSLRTSSLPKEERKDVQLYSHMIFLTVDNKDLKLIAQFNGKSLEVLSDYRLIIPLENTFKREHDHITIRIKLKRDLKWRDVKKNIQSLEKGTEATEVISDTDSYEEEQKAQRSQRLYEGIGPNNGDGQESCFEKYKNWIYFGVGVLACIVIVSLAMKS